MVYICARTANSDAEDFKVQNKRRSEVFYRKVRCSEHAKVDEVTSTLKRKQTVRNPVGVISDMQGCEEALRVPQINGKKLTGRGRSRARRISDHERPDVRRV